MRRRLSSSLSFKLLAGQLLVVIAGAGTLLLVAVAVGPGIFHRHVQDALGYVPPGVQRHLNMAYGDATLISLAVAVGAAVLMALAISTLVSTRVVGPVKALAGAAQRIARGARTARVPEHGSDELAQLARSFNEMASSLEQADHVRRQLLADVAHELRNPLATIESYVEALSEGVLPADEENWGALRTETARLSRLVNDLQEVSRAEAHQLELNRTRVDIAAIIGDAIRAAAPAFAAKGVALDQSVAAPPPTVEVDRGRISEVLANLLANALRHTQAGGTVVVSGGQVSRLAEISVADSGEGIAPEHLERVFERFFRADPARARASGGTGIGLAIVRAIVEAHGGTVGAASEGIGRGATFTVRLPLAGEAPPEGRRVAAPSRATGAA